MNFIRTLVSQKKTRYINDEYNLDLTYITPRIIAMSFPSSGFMTLYRNPISQVSSFLSHHHGDSYLVVNASDKSYDTTPFKHKVFNITWQDHHPCAFIIYLQSLIDISSFLLQNIKNVVVVHCMAGKGRTGSFINGLLLISGLFESIEDSNKHYKDKRNVNVTHASQLRFLKYFERFLKEGSGSLCYKVKSISKVVLKTRDHSFLKEGKFVLSIYDFTNNVKLLTRIEIDGMDSYIKGEANDKRGECIYERDIKNWSDFEARDIRCFLTVNTPFKIFKGFRTNFNLFFEEESVCFRYNELDACYFGLPKDFSITLFFEEKKKEGLPEKWRETFKNIEKDFDKLKNRLISDKERKAFLYQLL